MMRVLYMYKKIMLLSLSLIFNNNFCETSAEKTTTNDVDKRIALKQLDIFEKENRELQEARIRLYSTERQFVNGLTLVVASASIGAMILSMTSEQQSWDRKQVIGTYGVTCIAIAGTLAARDMWLSSDLKTQQTCLNSSIKNIQQADTPKKM